MLFLALAIYKPFFTKGFLWHTCVVIGRSWPKLWVGIGKGKENYLPENVESIMFPAESDCLDWRDLLTGWLKVPWKELPSWRLLRPTLQVRPTLTLSADPELEIDPTGWLGDC